MINYMKPFKNLYNVATSNKHYLIGASILRIAIGIHIAFTYLVYFTKRHEIWGPNSFYLLDYTKGKFLSLYSFNDSILYFEILYFLGIIINTLYLLGVKTRVVGVLNYIMIYSLYARNPLALDGGNNILIIILFYLMFAEVNRYFSISKGKNTDSNKFSNMFHNCAIFMCLFQVCILYFFSGFAKSQGHMWYNGTALYYILHVDEFTQPFLAQFIINSPVLLTLGAYSAIITQLFFPLCVFNKYLKIPILLGSISFHFVIIIMMGLIQFGLIMIALDILFLTDKEHKKFYMFLKKFKERRLQGGKGKKHIEKMAS
ncbi:MULTISPECIES: HTTM domain-containing protein [Bacillus]|uniref:HTTM domain-containing protein n=1 Tax=Bacillus TaxID=1386 RepID=UPI000BEB8B52|nr:MULTISPECIES: HTTM domain-containing protein [Bacillus]MBY7130198.1 HTTM domain-containing protein [Bacillus sp. 8YEL33]PEA63051.1 HTTM domain-containing protein [Bacillus toyonensis]PGA32590.1 HTTM domain-containing protein [Bacillus toyonensis]HDR7379644.1 HTTM domain-containing protein [Bacillus toyonensis]